jgi:hypothetical protein
MKKDGEFYWNKDTLDHFVKLAKTATMTELSAEVISFVSADCALEDCETYQDLYDDLMSKIVKQVTKFNAVNNTCSYSGLPNTKNYE